MVESSEWSGMKCLTYSARMVLGNARIVGHVKESQRESRICIQRSTPTRLDLEVIAAGGFGSMRWIVRGRPDYRGAALRRDDSPDLARRMPARCGEISYHDMANGRLQRDST